MELVMRIGILVELVLFVLVILFIASSKTGSEKDVNGSHDDTSREDPYKADDHWDKNNTSR